ncbi:type IV pilin [Clostridium perfringens]|uniref:Type IV pilin n=1 Tax=Clostridium perfringens TaxID=1502 RepID=A0AAW9I4J1_CLOPF|nr:type IV pilin [Clostridium perfringens]WEV15282.1 type IV pilin [Clostridium perfringens D]EHK2363146.1 type IV pilin [Clostridium perfringens]EJT5926871.1 type IV pilin [Clostridium perfringens]EJT6152355.1 type IV pilin [Clostridium perfringens]EJT6481657.1 type IV pilin [Clostridium perfringens]
MKRRKGFVSIEVMLVSLICSMIVTILMDNSFQRRKELDRSFKITCHNIDKNNSEEQFLKYMLKEKILNIDNINKLDFTLNNMNATYIEDKKAIHIKSKDKISGVFKDTYYGIDFRNDDIVFSKRRNYEFVNKDLSN